ncbi:MAG: CerR family C-terminal domain-containing protein [Proteobacteria bacterium]|nr:CerR family C-terminal domain-containing protein [Pseudomonadota bacterium]MBU4294804.1 CerR family C-terminal domain-containing protein [Pseudomonadota bacterium]MCG2748082.1 CerR family C-terminal domain-containing protein [Desulfobulbaceae bacterium]
MDQTTQTKSAPATGTTRSRLIEAGLDIFGECGYTGATTRMIADQGGVNLAAIPYHFGGKEGLYGAVIDHIVTSVRGQLDPILHEIEDRLGQGRPEPDEAQELLEKFLGRLVDFVVGSKEAPRFSRIILREQMSPSSAYDNIYEGIMRPILVMVAALLAIITGRKAGADRETRLRAFCLIGQIMAFRFARETLVRNLGLQGYSPDETAEIHRIVMEQTRAALFGLKNQAGAK